MFGKLKGSKMNEKNEDSKRAIVLELENILGLTFNVLDDGFIRVIDYMGSDESIVQAARVSYGKGTKKVNEDRGLIRYLMRNQHTTPFEMCEIKFHIRVPMDCWRQWIRHRTANVNEYSTRYSIAIDSFQKTEQLHWRKQSESNKQGSEEFFEVDLGKMLTQKEEWIQMEIRKIYEERLSLGVAREQARKDLPLSTYTEAYWKIDLHNLLHFLKLRMDELAQTEIRCYANIIGNEIVRKWCPLTWEAFIEYQLKAIQLSQVEIDIIKMISSGNFKDAIVYAQNKGLLSDNLFEKKKNREREEIEKKLVKLGIIIPWKRL